GLRQKHKKYGQQKNPGERPAPLRRRAGHQLRSKSGLNEAVKPCTPSFFQHVQQHSTHCQNKNGQCCPKRPLMERKRELHILTASVSARVNIFLFQQKIKIIFYCIL
ncbi:MAG TPA: hypothetical protein PLJ38_04930, partial [bacterium]|nr:hypothetical protein [bacterium]